MLLFFQFALFLFILLSFFLVIGVPVVFASPEGWTTSRSFVFSGISAWFVLLIVVGLLNSFVT